MADIKGLVQSILSENPNLSNEQVAEEIRKQVPGSKTSPASVSSMKSHLRKAGTLVEPIIEALPTFEPASADPFDTETDEERYDRIRRRYATLERMADRVASGSLPALIVSGPPGLGKSYTVEKVLEEQEVEHDIICGTITAVGLYLALYHQKDGGVVVLDDCDDVFRDETCLNILKAVLDSSETRRVSYRKRANWLDQEDIPDNFEFNGSVVFCTNVDFEAAIIKGSNMGAHFAALIDRSLYLSLTMRTRDDFITRIRQVTVDDGMLENNGLTKEQAEEVVDFISENAKRFYGLSIRLAHQIGICLLEDPETWKDDIEATKMRTL